MSATILHLVVAESATDAPVDAVVERLREMLAQAESGELRGLAAVALMADGSIVYGHDHDRGGAAWARLLAGATCLQAHIVEAR